MIVRIVKRGEKNSRGVAFLTHGSMVVIEGAGDAIGREARVRVTKVFRTSAGVMIFAQSRGG